MAELGSLQVLKNIKERSLQCPICLELLKDPRALSCLHRFCCECLQNICFKGKSPGTPISCPICRKQTDIPRGGAKELPSDFLLRDILENIQVTDDIVSGECGSCSTKGKLLKFCTTCKCVICDGCVAQHAKMKALQGHPLESLEYRHTVRPPDSHQEPQTSSSTSKCVVHREETVYYQCKDCEDQLICNTCLNTSHKNHDILSINEISETVRKEIVSQLDVLSKMTTDHQTILKSVQTKKKDLKFQTGEGKKLIELVSKEAIEAIQNQRKCLLDEIGDKEELLVNSLSRMEEILVKNLESSADLKQKVSKFLSQRASHDAQSISVGRGYVKDLGSITQLMTKYRPDVDRIKKSHLRFHSSRTTPQIGTIHSSNMWKSQNTWDVGLVHDPKETISGMMTLPSGKILLSISRAAQSTYAIISAKDGSIGWRKNFSIQNFPPYTPCYAVSLEKNAVIMAWRHVVTRYDMTSNKSSSYGKKVPAGAVVKCLAADYSDERVLIAHSAKNEICLFDGELNEAREMIVPERCNGFEDIVVHHATKTYLVCDGHSKAFAVDKYSGKTVAYFTDPSAQKDSESKPNAICGTNDCSVFVLWSSCESSWVIQYLPSGIPVSRIKVDNEAKLMVIALINDRECLVICSGKGKFFTYMQD